jgi:hypothetical protein
MHKRNWDAKTKAMIALEDLKGKPVAELYAEHQISQSPYYQCRDQVLAHAGKAFEGHQHTRTEACLAQENARLKKLVGELTMVNVATPPSAILATSAGKRAQNGRGWQQNQKGCRLPA